jgi:hypothetical protein
MYIPQNNLIGSVISVWCNTNNIAIPIDPANSDYQIVLDDIIEQGASCFTGDIPTELQTAADAKQFAQQVEAYKIAKARIAQYQLSVGVPESSETIVTGQEWNEETLVWEDVTETVVIPAIEALDATIDVTTYDDEGTGTTTTVANPVITKDIEERAASQTIIDSTPSAVKTHVDG